MPPSKKQRTNGNSNGSLLVGLDADGQVLLGAKAAAFSGCGVDSTAVASEPLHGTMEEFAAENKGDAALLWQLRNTIKKCAKCSKACGFSMKACNSCGAALPSEVTHSHNIFMGFVYGVSSAPFPLKISIRSQTQDLVVFDDLLALSPCHLNVIPTHSYIPDWRFLLRKPAEGLRLLATLEDAAWECAASQFLRSEAWGTKMLRGGPARTRRQLADLRAHVVAGCNFPPSQVYTPNPTSA